MTVWSRANARRELSTARLQGSAKAGAHKPRGRTYGYDTLKVLIGVWRPSRPEPFGWSRNGSLRRVEPGGLVALLHVPLPQERLVRNQKVPDQPFSCAVTNSYRSVHPSGQPILKGQGDRTICCRTRQVRD